MGEYRGGVTAEENGSIARISVHRKMWDYILLGGFLLPPWSSALVGGWSLWMALEVFGVMLAVGLAYFWLPYLNDLKETRIELHCIWYAKDMED